MSGLEGVGVNTQALSRGALSALALSLLLAPGAALASGGGGGGGGGGMGGMPSMSAPAYDPVIEYQKGQDALQLGKFRDAEDHFDNALSVDPKNADTLFMYGMAKAGRGDLKGAAHAYEKSLKIDPNQIPARREYAVALAKTGQADKAQAQFAILKERATTCGDACPEAADLKAAVAAVQAALAPAPGAAAAPASLLLIDPKAGDGAYVEAVRLINDHRYRDALGALDKARAAFGPHPDVLTYTGYAWRKLGQYDKAEFYYREALGVAPNHVGATEYYGELMVIRGDLAGARRMLAKLDSVCTFGCVESEDLRRWIEKGPPAA
jgi:tetratricopeptide (TPR) repeat protein